MTQAPKLTPFDKLEEGPQTHAVQTVIDGACARLETVRERIVFHERRGGDREDHVGVKRLLDSYLMLVDQAREFIDRQVLELVDEDPELRISHLSSIRNCVRAVESATVLNLEALLRSPGRDFEPLIAPFIDLAKDATGRHGTELIFEAQEDFRYAILADAFELIKDNLDQISPDYQAIDGSPIQRIMGSADLGVVTYPIRADADTFRHAVVAHEIAHLALSRPWEDEKSLREVAFEKTDLQNEDLPPGNESERGRREEDTKRRKRWLDELACDLLAVRMIGPVYFFALVELIVPAHQVEHLPGLPGYSSHPSVIWRLELLLDELADYIGVEEGEALVHARAVLSRFTDLISVAQEISEERLSDADKTERKKLKDGLDYVRGEAEALLGNHGRYEPGIFRDDVGLIWRKLKQHISPAEKIAHRPRQDRDGLELELAEDAVMSKTGEAEAPDELKQPNSQKDEEETWSEPFDWRSILNGCFIYHASGESRRDAGRDAGSPEEQRAADNQLCRGTIELAQIHHRMRELRRQFQHMQIV
jgi:hypothetical protein